MQVHYFVNILEIFQTKLVIEAGVAHPATSVNKLQQFIVVFFHISSENIDPESKESWKSLS